MSRIALIDADEIAYKLAIGYQRKLYTILKDDKVLWRTKYKEEAIESIGNRDDLEIGEEIEVYDCKDYKQQLDTTISSILSNTSSSEYRLYLSGSNNFRYTIATLQPYKGNRSEDKPIYLGLIQSELKSRGAESVDHLEADDLLSINETCNENTVICSSDKDLRTVPSLNYNITKGILTDISEDEANYNFFYQLLIGDSTDNIPSPYGLGDVKAKNFLDSLGYDFYGNIASIITFYNTFLKSKKKDGTYKTSWYSDQDTILILEEVGNLLWMRRTYDPDERWRLNG